MDATLSNPPAGPDTETDTALREAARRFLADCCSHGARTAGKALGGQEAWRRMAELGWFALAVPEAREGLGGTDAQLLSLLEEAGRALATAPLIDNLVVAPPVLALCDAGLAARFMAGEARFSLVQADARRAPLRWHAGDGTLALHGTSAPCLSTEHTTHWIVVAHHAGTQQAGVFVLPAGTPGSQATPVTLMDGCEGSLLRLTGGAWHQADVTLAEGDAAQALGEALADRAAAAAVAEACGAADAALRLTLDYLRQRVQFGKPLSRLQAVQHAMADAFCSLEQQRSLLSWLSRALGGEVATRRRAVSCAKAFLGGRTRQAVETCIQLSGGIGVTDEYVLGHYYKRLLVRSTMHGDRDAHLQRLARDARRADAEAPPPQDHRRTA